MVYNGNQPAGDVSVLVLSFKNLAWNKRLILVSHVGPYHEYKYGIITLNITMQRYPVNLSYGKKLVYIVSLNADVHSKIKNMFNNGKILTEIITFTRSKNCLFFEVCPWVELITVPHLDMGMFLSQPLKEYL